MWNFSQFCDYELLDASDGERLERWKDVILVRPDPQVIWRGQKKHAAWNSFNARYIRSQKGGGKWDIRNIPEDLLCSGWTISYKDMNFLVRPTGFKHTGIFPEQAVNWDYIREKIHGEIEKTGRNINALNLFAYTGGATIACAKAGAHVCHVDASKGIVSWARENTAKSGLENAPIRYIVDDCTKFIEREIRRGHKYDVLIMDPPSYGRGPSGEIWKLEDDINDLIKLSSQLISENPLFVLVNSYTTGLSASTVGYLLNLYFKSAYGGKVTCDEIGIPVSYTGGILPAGACARWEI